jgi:large conductance mechanosensitive channel
MRIFKEFRAFALKGNVLELAVAVIIASAFGSIVSSLVDDVITPLLLTPALKAAKAEDLAHLTWGAVKFLIIAFILFLIVKGMNSLQKKEILPPEVTPEDIQLLREIRDSLKK